MSQLEIEVSEIRSQLSRVSEWCRPFVDDDTTATRFMSCRIHELCGRRLGLRAASVMIGGVMYCQYDSPSVEMMFRAEYDAMTRSICQEEFGVCVYNVNVVKSLAECFRFVITSVTADEVANVHYITMLRSSVYDDDVFIIRNYERVLSGKLPTVIVYYDGDLRQNMRSALLENRYCENDGSVYVFEACCDEERVAVMTSKAVDMSRYNDVSVEVARLMASVRVEMFVTAAPVTFSLQICREKDLGYEEICSRKCRDVMEMNKLREFAVNKLPSLVTSWWRCASAYNYDVSPAFHHIS